MPPARPVPLAVLVLLAASAAGQGPPGSREAMWPAPTAEDWSKPVQIEFQRSWEDAVAVSRETGKPILVCVNMDGEIASEHYAGIRYRDPEIAKLFEPYVCVVASVYRHNPRDYDERGRRILCPRFGSVTCGEHIWIEPILYEKYFDGERVAPRHVAIELDGSEVYDVYYAWDTQSVFDTIEHGLGDRPAPPPVVRGDRPIVERVASRHVADREAVEGAYREGDEALRRALLEAAIETGEDAPLDLLRLAVRGFDPEMAALARRALAKTDDPDATGLLADALAVPMEEEQREALIGALERIGDEAPRARTLAVVHRGLSSRASAIDPSAWTSAVEDGAPPAGLDEEVVRARLEYQDQTLASRDPGAKLELAESFLARAYEHFAEDPDHARLLFMDARRAAREAEALGADGWRLDKALAIAAYYLDETEEAHARAEAAVTGGLPKDAPGWDAMAVLAIFAQARQQAIQEAVAAKEDWPPQWFTDVHATYSVLAEHPFGTVEQVAAHHDFLAWLGAGGQAAAALERGLERFPSAWELHERLRRRLLWDHGVEALEARYEEMLAEEGASADLHDFAGWASLRAAEFRRRRGRGEADAAYDRAIAHFEEDAALNPETRGQADEAIARALGAKARLAYERGDDARALELILASFERDPWAAATLDGLNISTVDTARMVLARLKHDGEDEAVARLEAALAALPPRMLELPEYEPRTGRGARGR